MRKKVLLSLIAAGAAPVGALADVDVTALVEQTGWEISGVDISVVDGKDIIAEKGVVSTSAAAKLRVRLQDLPEGNYTLHLWEGGVGAKKFNDNVKVSVGDATNIVAGKPTNDLKFTVEKAGDVILLVESADEMHGFSIRIKSLIVDLENFLHVHNQLQPNKLDNLSQVENHLTNPSYPEYLRAKKCGDQWGVGPDDDSQTAKDLATEADAINEKLDRMGEIITELNTTPLVAANNAADHEQALEKAQKLIEEKEGAEEKQKTVVENAEKATAVAQEAYDNGVQAINDAKAEVAAAQTKVDEASTALEEATAKLAAAKAAQELADWNEQRAAENYANATNIAQRIARRADWEAAKLIQTKAQEAYDKAFQKEKDATAAYGLAEAELLAAQAKEEAAVILVEGKDIKKGDMIEVEKNFPFIGTIKVEILAPTDMHIPGLLTETLELAKENETKAKSELEKKQKAVVDAQKAYDQLGTDQEANEARVLELWKEYNTLADVLDNDAVKKHNDNVTAENERYAREDVNHGNYWNFKNQLDVAQAALDAIVKDADDLAKLEGDKTVEVFLDETVNDEMGIKHELIKILHEYVNLPKEAIAEDVAAVQNTIDDLNARIEKLYVEEWKTEDGKKVPAKYVDEQTPEETETFVQNDIDMLKGNVVEDPELIGMIGQLKAEYDEAVADVEAKTKLDQYKEQLRKIHDANTHDLQDVRDGLAADVMDQLQKLFNEEDAALDEAIARDWTLDHENEKADAEKYNDTLKKMFEHIDAIHDRLHQNEVAYAELMKYIGDPEGTENDGSVVKGIADVKGKLNEKNIQDSTTKKLLDDYLESIEDELAALQNNVEDEYEHYNLKSPDGEEEFTHEEQVKNLLNKIKALDTAIGNAADYDGFLAEITALQNDLEEARKAIKAEVTVKVDDVDAEAVAVAFDDTYNALQTALKKYNERITNSLKAVVTEDDLAQISSNGLTQEEKGVLDHDIKAYQDAGVDAAKKYNEELVLCSTLTTESSNLKALVEEWSKKENGKYVYAVDGEKSKLAAWAIEASDYDTLVKKYKDEVVDLLAKHAEHDANNFIKAVKAFNNSDINGEINKVDGKVEMNIAELSAEYFAGKRVDFAINGVVADNLAKLNDLKAEYDAVNDAAKYGEVGVAAFKAEIALWNQYISALTAVENGYEKSDAQIADLQTLTAYAALDADDKAYEPAVVAQYWQYVADKADHLKKAETSQNNYVALEAEKGTLQNTVGTAVSKAKDDIDAITRTINIEANKYYKAEIDKLVNGEDGSYTKQIADLVAEYTNEYEAIAKNQEWAENDGISNAQKTGYHDRLVKIEGAFKYAVAALIADADANEATHNLLLAKEQTTINEINTIIDWFENLEDNDVKVENMTRNDILAALKELKNENTEDLPGVSKVNNEVIASYSNGLNDEEYQKLYDEYDALKKKAEALKSLVMDQYQNAVWTANRTFANNLFDAKYAELLKLFKNGVDTFEAYAYCKAVVEETHNADYEIAIREYLTGNDHANDIYAYSALIIELENEVDALVEEASNYTTDEKNPAELHELSLADFRMLLGKYDLYKGDADLVNTPADVPFYGMIGYATYIAEQANNFAMNWLTEDVTVVDDDLNVIAGKYNGEGALDVAVTTIENALNGFAAQEISESVQEVYTKEAKALYETAKMQIIAALGVNIGTEETPNIVNQLSQHMCTILETLSKINVDVEAAAYSHWSNELRAAKIRFTEIQALVNAINASGVDVTAQLAQLEGVESSIWGEKGIKASVEKDYADGILLGAVKRYVDALKNKMAEAENALKAAEAAKAKAVANAQALAQFKKDLEALKEAYNELCAGVGGLDLTLDQFRTVYTVGVEDQIDALEADLDGKYKYCANDKKDEVQEMFDDAYEAIQKSYTAAWKFQKKNLDELMHITRYAFDVVKAANTDKYGEVTDADKLDKWNADMDELAQIIADNSSEKVWFSPMVKPAVILDNLSTAEDDLEEILQKILKYAAENGIEFNEESGITEWLENDVEGVATSIQDAINVLDENYNDGKEAYEAADAVLGQLEDAGFYTSGNYKEDVEAFNDLMTQLDAEKAQWEKEGDFVVLTEPRHSHNINAIDKKIAEYKAKFQKAVDLEKAHKARLEVLQDEINTLETAYNNVLNIDTYEKVTEADYKEIYADGIELYLQMSKDGLADADENKYLVEWRDNVIEETYANYLKTAIEILIKDLDEKMLALEVARQKSAAQDLVDKINEIFVGDDFADMIGLNAQLDDINEQNDKLQPAYVGQIVEIFEEEYEITLEDIQSLSHEVVDAAKKLLADLKENAIVRGDVSCDGKVSVLDYNKLLRMILTGNNAYDQGVKEKVAADVNKNARIDVADITSLVNILTGKSQNRVAAQMRPQTGANNALALSFVSEENGVRRLAVSMNNATVFANAQMDIVLPEGLSVVAATAADKASELDFHTNDLGDGRFRVVFASSEIRSIAAGEGVLFYLDIQGSASSDITVAEAIASDALGTAYVLNLDKAVATGVNSITDSVIAGVKRVYNLGGQMLNEVKQGVNIILGNDGKAKKVIKK